MIPRRYITAWSTTAPWPAEYQVEQDLILSRMIIEIANNTLLGRELAFRGGTCLHKLHFARPFRYSEDLDFVRTSSTPMLGECFTELRAIATKIGLEEIRRSFPNQNSSNGTIIFRATAANERNTIRVKIEINVAEVATCSGYHYISHTVKSPWWTAAGHVQTFSIEELLATKVRALYQRRKGRDLFDLWVALTQLEEVDTTKIAHALKFYMKETLYSYPQLHQNLKEKTMDPQFLSDIHDLTTDLQQYEPKRAVDLVLQQIGQHLRNAP